jgi:hemoglobin/transferrin/lactoferrin receptor protein
MKLNFYLILSIIVFNFLSCKTIPRDNNDAIQKGLNYDKSTLFSESSPYLMPYNRIIDGVGTSINFGNPDYENHSLDLVMIPNTDLVVVEDRFGIAVFDTKSKSLINRWEYRQNPDYKNLMSSFSGIKAIVHKDSTYIFWGTGGREKSNCYVMQASWNGKEIKILKAIPFQAIAPAPLSLPNEVLVKSENGELYLYTVLNGNNQLIKTKVSNMEQIWASPTGVCPYGLCEVDDKVFVSNWAGPKTNPNDGLETAGIPWGSAYIDPKTGAMSRGTVSVIDSKSGKFIKEIEVGLHPNAIILSKDKQTIFVANGNSDNISVIDVKKSLLSSAQKSDSTKTELLKEVIVSSQRISEKNLKTAASITVLSSKNLKNNQVRTTPEALMNTAGVFIQKSTHGAGSPFVRGLTGNQTLILIDGIRLNNSTFRYGPNQYLNTIDPFSLDRIEVLRGSGSVAYGSDALGGTVQLFTANPEFANKTIFNANALTRFASSDMEKTFHSDVSFGSKNVALKTGLSIRNFGDIVGGDTTGRQSPSGYKELAFDFKGKFKLSEKWETTLSHQFVEQKNIPLYYRIKLENFAVNEFNPQKRSLSYFQLNGKTDKQLLKSIGLTASLQNTSEQRNSRRNGNDVLRIETDKVETLGLTFNVISSISNSWIASSGLEFYQDVVNSDRIDQNIKTNSIQKSRGLYPDNSKFQSYAIYSLHQIQRRNWQFNFGGRLNGFNIKIMDDNLGSVNVEPKALVYNLSLAYELSENSSIYALHSTGFRSPNVDDMGTLGIVDFRYELPTYNLKPEKSYNFELGYKLRKDRFATSLALFNTNLEDLITRIKVENQQINGINVYRKENTENAFIRGFEAEMEFLVSNSVKILSNASYAFGQNLTKNEPLRRIPPMNGKLGIEYRKNSFFVRPEIWFASAQTRLAQGDKDDIRIGKDGTKGWATANIFSGFDKKHYSINLSIQNLNNADYRTHGSGINGVGRSAWITILGKI